MSENNMTKTGIRVNSKSRTRALPWVQHEIADWASTSVRQLPLEYQGLLHQIYLLTIERKLPVPIEMVLGVARQGGKTPKTARPIIIGLAEHDLIVMNGAIDDPHLTVWARFALDLIPQHGGNLDDFTAGNSEKTNSKPIQNQKIIENTPKNANEINDSSDKIEVEQDKIGGGPKGPTPSSDAQISSPNAHALERAHETGGGEENPSAGSDIGVGDYHQPPLETYEDDLAWSEDGDENDDIAAMIDAVAAGYDAPATTQRRGLWRDENNVATQPTQTPRSLPNFKEA